MFSTIMPTHFTATVHTGGTADRLGTASRSPDRPRGIRQARQRTEFLCDTLGSGAALAGLLGVSRSQPTRWRQGAEVPSPETGRLLIDLDHVMARATALWAPEVALAWLTGANAFLSGARPIDVLRSAGSRDVVSALDAALAGAYA
ncbi:MAG: MbcA/ParS/Xre antitoxin family protein [Bifidobacteriaceae bacterium]|jgi:uncharacterized protein (DUF2384 family)|nr:MbcA/ParS/Xre antitoxin family protein [Bifidobacteriaceae bacterium]